VQNFRYVQMYVYVCISHRAYRFFCDFQAQGFTAKDFDVMCGIASWATCGPARSRETSIPEEHDGRYAHTDEER